MEQYQTSRNLKPEGVVDICFLLDATSSMQPCIDAVKNGIRHFINSLTSPESNGGIRLENWRASICAYRDITYEPKFGKEWLIMHDFTDDVATLDSQLGALVAEGGGDEPESLLDALYYVVNRGRTEKNAPMEPGKWRYAHEAERCVVVLTDASYHPKMEDSGATVRELIPILMQEHIHLILFAPEMPCHYELSCLDTCTYEAIEVPEGDINGTQKAVAEYVSNPQNFNNALNQAFWRIFLSPACFPALYWEDIEEL